jgi:hypothetical protein
MSTPTPAWARYQGVTRSNKDDNEVSKPDPMMFGMRKFSENATPTMGLSLSTGNVDRLAQLTARDAQVRAAAEQLKKDTLLQPNISVATSALFPSFVRSQNAFDVPPPTPDTSVSQGLVAPTMSMTAREISPQLLRKGDGAVVPLDVAGLDDLANYVYPRTLSIRRLVTLLKRARVFVPTIIHDPGKVTEVTLSLEHNKPISDGDGKKGVTRAAKVYRVYVEAPPVAFERMRIDQLTNPRPAAMSEFNSEAPISIKIQVSVPDPISMTVRTYAVVYDDAIARRELPLEEVAEDAANAARPAVPLRRRPFFLREVSADAASYISSVVDVPMWGMAVLIVVMFAAGLVTAAIVYGR